MTEDDVTIVTHNNKKNNGSTSRYQTTSLFVQYQTPTVSRNEIFDALASILMTPQLKDNISDKEASTHKVPQL